MHTFFPGDQVIITLYHPHHPLVPIEIPGVVIGTAPGQAYYVRANHSGQVKVYPAENIFPESLDVNE